MTAIIWKSLPNLIQDGGLFNSSIVMGEALNTSEDAVQAEMKLKLLSGEVEVTNVRNARFFSPSIKKQSDDEGVKGILIVTNFRLSFLSVDDKQDENQVSIYQENNFLGKTDVPLSNIDQIYQISDKKKKLFQLRNNRSNGKIDSLEIICKNFRILKFGFRDTDINSGYKIANTLMRFAFPNQHNLLFSYKYREPYYSSFRNVSFFNLRKDWAVELMRCGATGWHVMTSEREVPEGTLPVFYVIPKNLTNSEYLEFSRYFRNSRAAIWVWGHEKAALVRMADLISTLPDTSRENAMMEKVRDCHPDKKQPHLLELTRILPSIQDVYASYLKLRELCIPDNARTFMVQDSRFYSQLEKSSWLLYVSLCLKYSSEMADKLKQNETVVLQENDGRDMSAVISSLIQIILDPQARTINGFQSLIQKEWVALGHPFSDRLGLVKNDNTSEESPLFLLFLDCVWQLLIQYREDFEYSETYLTTLWDSVFLPIFDTFQFNCEYDRYNATRPRGNSEPLILRPVWDWGEQFSDKDIALFSNPLYKKPPDNVQYRKTFVPVNAVALPILGSNFLQNSKNQQPEPAPSQNFLENVRWNMRHLELWTQCYYRWLPYLEIPNGGQPQIDLYHRILLNNIVKLQNQLETRDFDDLQKSNEDLMLREMNTKNLPSINSFFPFSRSNICDSNDLIDILTQNSEVLTDGSIFDRLSISQAPD